MHKSLIIGGTNKAGTTSLFEYLREHPEIQGSFIKQTFFFLDSNLQEKLKLKANYDYKEGLHQFAYYFPDDMNKKHYCLEASPDYLYGKESPDLIYSYLQNKVESKLLFILREPVSRFISFFYYSKQQGLIDNEMSFREFYEKSKNYEDDTNSGLRAHKTGYYAKYLKNYLKLLPKQNLIVCFFEDLEKDPEKFMKDLSDTLGIDPDFYNDFDFQIKNKTAGVRNQFLSKVFRRSRAWYMKFFFKSKLGLIVGEFLKEQITPFYKKINLVEKKKYGLDSEVLNFLKNDYAQDISELESLVGKKAPWEK